MRNERQSRPIKDSPARTSTLVGIEPHTHTGPIMEALREEIHPVVTTPFMIYFAIATNAWDTVDTEAGDVNNAPERP